MMTFWSQLGNSGLVFRSKNPEIEQPTNPGISGLKHGCQNQAKRHIGNVTSTRRRHTVRPIFL